MSKDNLLKILTPEQVWINVKNLITNQRGEVNISIKEIIKKTNNVFHRVRSGQFMNNPLGAEIREREGSAWATAAFTPGDTYLNNNGILSVLLEGTPDGYSHGPMVQKIGHYFRSSLSRANNAVAREARTPVISEPVNITDYLSNDSSMEITALKSGRIQDYILKLDSALFQEIFSDGLAIDLLAGFAPESRFVSDRLTQLFRPKNNQETFLDYFQLLNKRILYSSRAFESRNLNLALATMLFSAPAVDAITERWNTQYSLYTGISSNMFNNVAFDRAYEAIGNTVVSGLFAGSKISQKVRLVANMQVREDSEEEDTRNFNRLISNRDGPMQLASEEYRTFYMLGNNEEKFFSSPVADYSKIISDFGQGVELCYDIDTFKEDYKRLQPWMTQQLLETDDAKHVFQYIFPVKRYQSVITAFVTSTLSGYSSMPQIMQSPKASLAALMGIAGTNTKQSLQILENLSQAELMKKLSDANASQQGLDCFGFPFNSDFLNQLEDLLKELFFQFPSIFFRGIANAIDPAYQEMHGIHYINCNIDNLKMGALRFKQSVTRRNMTAGVSHNSTRLEGTGGGEYSSVITAPFADIPYGAYKAFLGNYAPLGRALERMVGYIIKGPISLIEGSFSFNIPCANRGAEWPDPNREPWNSDRYGHPISPLTVLALITPELSGDKMLRSCSIQQNLDSQEFCQDPEDSPFGELPEPEE